MEALDAGPIGNPSSVHAAGRRARALVETARASVARALGADPLDVVLTAGGTEGITLAIEGVARARARGASTGRVAWCTAVDHPAVLAAMDASRVRVGSTERIEVPRGLPPSAASLVERAREREVAFVACPWIHHETGVVFPVGEYARALAPLGVPLVVDAIQALGRVPIDVATLAADVVVVASEKVGGPAGAGALWVRRGAAFDPVPRGGGQERGRRGGTEPLLALVGLGAAASEAATELERRGRELDALGRTWIDRVCAMGGLLNAADAPRHLGIVSTAFEGVRSDHLVAALDVDGVAISAGSACSSGRPEPSPSLLAMYPDEPWRARASLRASFGPELAVTDVERAAELLNVALLRLRR
ncbi:MAG: aminotransferase class V-fold PLP-dependent enzyme [Deltaproteobacteria bacterium]|nr:aminotransferase class V-fold PLP-dependent enzyme [Deltaproteobacteria bacterium]